MIKLARIAGALVLAVAGPLPAFAHPPAPAPAEASPKAPSDAAGPSSSGSIQAAAQAPPKTPAKTPAKAPPRAPDEDIPAPPPTYKANAVTIDEHVGGKLPLDTAFRTQDGAPVTLGDVMRGDLPAILTFNYSDCPMLCNVQLTGLTTALPRVGARGPSPDTSDTSDTSGTSKGDAVFQVGAQFRIVTIDLEPNETPEKAAQMRERFLARIPEAQRATARAGWTFLIAPRPGDDASIHRVANAVGFRYAYIAERAEWAHPAALILLSAAGVVTRYIYGIEYDPAVLRESIYKAGIAEPSTAVGFMLRCYHYDPGANSHARAGVIALRVGAAGFVVLLLGALGAMHHVRRAKRVPPVASNGVT